MAIILSLQNLEKKQPSKALGAAVLTAISQHQEVTLETLIEILSSAQPDSSFLLWTDARERAEAVAFLTTFIETAPSASLH